MEAKNFDDHYFTIPFSYKKADGSQDQVMLFIRKDGTDKVTLDSFYGVNLNEIIKTANSYTFKFKE